MLFFGGFVMRFTKMHGIGNDYIYVNCFEQNIDNPPQLAIKVSDRHFGIGSDGLILVGPSEKASVRMRIFNADGSEAEMCGNGIRCVVKFAYDNNLAEPSGKILMAQKSFPYSYTVETGKGMLTVGFDTNDEDRVKNVCVNMGEPVFKSSEIPVKISKDAVIEEPLEIDGQTLMMTCVSMGNPHAVFFSNNVDSMDLTGIGPKIENHDMFPNRINVHFVQPISESEFKMRTWERGSGITLACGTGACACLAAAVSTDKSGRETTAHLPGGDLHLAWSQQDNCIYMTGTATKIFDGTIEI